MDVGVGLPSMLPGTAREDVISWATTTEEAGFSTVAVLDRLVYDSWEPLVTLAVAAAVTRRVGLLSSVLLAPYRTDRAVLAKQAATVQVASGGRLTLGMAVGLRPDDYAATGADFGTRGRRLDALADELTALWAGSGPLRIGPHAAPALAFGGQSEAAVRRAGRRGGTWIAGGGGPDRFARSLAWARGIWADQAAAEPRTAALCYFALGDDAEHLARGYLGPYYAAAGPRFADTVIAAVPCGVDALRATVRQYRAAGCDELLLFPCSRRPDQLEALVDAVGPLAGAVAR